MCIIHFTYELMEDAKGDVFFTYEFMEDVQEDVRFTYEFMEDGELCKRNKIILFLLNIFEFSMNSYVKRTSS